MSANAEQQQQQHVDNIYHDEAADDIDLDDDTETAVAYHQEANERQKQLEQDSLHEDEVQPAADNAGVPLDPMRPCAQCGKPMGTEKSPSTKDGPIHMGCVLEYRFLNQPRCRYCGVRFLDSEASSFVKDDATGSLYHPECRQQELKKVSYVRPTLEGEVRKFAIARSKLSRHNWKTRYFILSPMYDGIRYFDHNPHGDASSSTTATIAAAEGGNGTDHTGQTSSGGSSADDDDVFDPDADPRLVAEHTKKSKGVVPLDAKRARLLTHPAASAYKVNSPAASMHSDIAVIFFDSPESTTERRLLFQCKDTKEKQEWVRALEGYIHIVDDPKDYDAKKK